MQKHLYPWNCHNALTLKPTIGQLMDLCEENYAQVMRLAPDLQAMQGHYLSSKQPHLDLHLEVVEQSPYTTLVHLTYFFDNSKQADPDALLRIYHDSRQVEVVDLKQQALPVVRNFDHPGLLLKWRANVFISKWLSYCLHQQHQFGRHSQVEQPDFQDSVLSEADI
ncbi:MAG: DUF1249 domain-containing protein [Chromatiales bacterium]|jgi:uncharacterized protein YqiB (DUF1249 family)